MKYYDSCVFGSAMNSEHTHHAQSKKALDIDAIDWAVSLNLELSKVEFPACEAYLDEFFVYSQLSGIEVHVINLADAKSCSKNNQAVKKKFSQIGFGGNDWTHLMSAVHSSSVVILSVDADFFDPAIKSGAKGSNRVAKMIKSEFGITVTKP